MAGTAPAVPPAVSELVLWEVKTGRQRLTLPQPDLLEAVPAFAPDGHTLVTATGKVRGFEAAPSEAHTLRVWELASGKERLTIRPGDTGWESRFEQIAFAPGGRSFATARADRTVQLWDAASGKELLRRTGCDAAVRCLAFSADGRLLATGHADGTALVWDLSAAGRTGRDR
jgi:WD40 repeat protein